MAKKGPALVKQRAQEDYVFQPHERAFLPGPPATPAHPMPRRIGYFAMGTLLGLAGGLGNSLLLANLPQIQGAFGLTPVEGNWLTATYSMTNVCMSLLLIKFRQQFGLQRFTRIFLVIFTLLAIAQVFVRSYGVELAMRAGAGVATSALTTLSFLYIMQAMPAAARLSGFVIGFGIVQVALPLSRVISPLLLEYGDIQNLFLFELGLVLCCLGGAALLRLPPSERIKAFEPLDFLTFALFAPGMALLCAVLAQGRTVWWSTPWIGYALAAAIPLIGGAMLVEHNRANPLLNTRWMLGRNIIRFAVVATVMRVLLSEQSYGSTGLLTIVGMGNDQLVPFNLVLTIASIAGLAAGLKVLNPADLIWPVVVSAILIAIGAFMDADASNLTRPAQLYVSQSLIAFAALFFLGPMVLFGLFRALAHGPNHIVSFSALFGITQTLGGLVGAASLGTFQIMRERYHSLELVQNLTAADPLVAGRIQTLGGAYARVLGDSVLRQGEGAALFAQQVSREANILAYNDVFMAIGVLATAVTLWLGTRYILLRMRRINPLAAELAAMAAMRATPGK